VKLFSTFSAGSPWYNRVDEDHLHEKE